MLMKILIRVVIWIIVGFGGFLFGLCCEWGGGCVGDWVRSILGLCRLSICFWCRWKLVSKSAKSPKQPSWSTKTLQHLPQQQSATTSHKAQSPIYQHY